VATHSGGLRVSGACGSARSSLMMGVVVMTMVVLGVAVMAI
jgi:hypothetical protein